MSLMKRQVLACLVVWVAAACAAGGGSQSTPVPSVSPSVVTSPGDTPGGSNEPTGPTRELPWPTPAAQAIDQKTMEERYRPIVVDAMAAAEQQFGPMQWTETPHSRFERSLNRTCSLAIWARGYNTALGGPSVGWLDRHNQFLARYGFDPITAERWSAGGHTVLATAKPAENVAYSVSWNGAGMLIMVEVGAVPGQCITGGHTPAEQSSPTPSSS